MAEGKIFTVDGNGLLVHYPVGQQLIINGKHCVVLETDKGATAASCEKCAITPNSKPVGCKSLACGMYERKDGKEVYFKQI